jgi:hypothetical protein
MADAVTQETALLDDNSYSRVCGGERMGANQMRKATDLGGKAQAQATFNAMGLGCIIICLAIFALLLFDEAVELMARF